MPPSEPSTSLLLAVQAGVPDAWHRLLLLYAPIVARWCRRAGLQSADVDDVLQEVFSTAAHTVTGFRRDHGSGSFVAWLATITRWRIRDHLNRRARQHGPVGGSDFQQRLEQEPFPPREDSSDEDDFQRLRLRRALQMVEEDVQPATWQAFWRTEVEQQAPRDVARELGVSVQAVRAAKFRVKQRLRQLLE
jgi:RNA polymerase sigma-70 factor (ECF subfamily)